MSFQRPIAAPATLAVLQRVAAGTPNQPILLLGPDGVGKGSIGRWLAASFLCEDSPRPCGKCQACRQVLAGSGSEFQVLDATLDGTVETFSILQRTVQLMPRAGRIQIALLEHLDAASPQALQGLLKLLEEGPNHTLFILTASSADGLPRTLRSRCLQLHLPLVPRDQLAGVAAGQGFRGPAAEATLNAAAGRPGVLLRLLGQPEELKAHSNAQRLVLDLCTLPLPQALAAIPESGIEIQGVLLAMERLLHSSYQSASNPRPSSIAQAVRELLEDADAGRFSLKASLERMLVVLHRHA